MTRATIHAPHQRTSTDPDQAVRVLEAHLGGGLATWQRFLLVAMLTPKQYWAIAEETDE